MHVFRILARLAGAALLIATAVIHLRLYSQGYSTVPKIGPLFLLNGVAGCLLAGAVLLTWGRLLRLAAQSAHEQNCHRHCASKPLHRKSSQFQAIT